MATTGATHVHLAFQAADRAAVDRFHAAALAAGGKDHGKPGVRAEYHPGYYGAFVIDPDGNNIEAVFHGEADRSAESVVISFTAVATAAGAGGARDARAHVGALASSAAPFRRSPADLCTAQVHCGGDFAGTSIAFNQRERS